jgi:membrane protein DedA with SNARE-associated domain
MTLAAVFPAASEVTMLYGGALASGAVAGHVGLFGHHFHQGFSAYLSVVIVGVAANTLGAAGGWLIGVYGGHPLLERYGRYAHITPVRIERAERWFDRFENVAVPLGFATPLVRSFVAIPAGMFEVGFARFILSALTGVTAFCAAIAGIGWAAGASWHAARHDLEYLELAVAALIVIFVAFLIVRLRRSTTMAESVDTPR